MPLRCSTVAVASTKGSGSIGRAPVSKTGGWGFDSLLPCSYLPARHTNGRGDMNRQTKRQMAKQGGDKPRAPERRSAAPNPQTERTSPAQYLSEVRGEMKKVAWPPREEIFN